MPLTTILGTFLLNNYKQALEILRSAPAALTEIKKEHGIADDSVFEKWLADERDYLRGLKTELQVETLEMEYYQKLVNLRASQ
jgi:hypothetical protein